MRWFSDSTIKVTIDSELQNVINSVINNAGAKNEADAIRYAVLHSVFPWDKNKPNKNSGKTKKRESIDKRTARLTATLEEIINTNESESQPIFMRITAAERDTVGATEIPVKHWQLSITERVIRDATGVNQAIASKFIDQHKAKIDQHNKWLFDNCGWTPKDAHSFNRRTKAAARKHALLDLEHE